MIEPKVALIAAVVLNVILIIVVILQARDKSKKRDLWEHTQHQLVEVLAKRDAN